MNFHFDMLRRMYQVVHPLVQKGDNHHHQMEKETSSMRPIEEVLETSRLKAEEIIGKSDEVRRAYKKGRPNSSDESTVEGVVRALGTILSNFPQLQREDAS